MVHPAELAVNEIGIVGFPKVFDSNVHWARRVFWLLVVFAGLGGTLYLIAERIKFHASEPKTVNIQLENRDSLQLPAITLCSLRFVGRDVLEDWQPGLSKLFSQFMYIAFSHHKQPELPNMDAIMSTAEFEEFYDISASGLLWYCWLPGVQCPQNTVVPTSTDYGACVTINADPQNMYNVTSVGENQGVWLYLATMRSDVIGLPDADIEISKGFALTLRDVGDTTYSVRKKSFVVPVGKEVKISVKKSTTSLLNTEEARCQESKLTSTPYNKDMCLEDCFLDILHTTCPCVAPILLKRGIKSEQRVCQTAYEWNCNIELLHVFEQNKTMQSGCGCLEACTTTEYNMIMSYADLLESYVPNNTDFTIVKIFYSSLAVETIHQQRAYTFWSMTSDIGGCLGLLLGASILTVIHVVDTILYLCTHRMFATSRKG